MRLPSKREVPGSNPTVGKIFQFVILLPSQLDKANANEINREIHLVNTLF